MRGGGCSGVITVDDVVNVIEEEAEEDILSLGGVGETGIFAPPWRTSLGRLPWLVVNLGTASSPRRSSSSSTVPSRGSSRWQC